MRFLAVAAILCLPITAQRGVQLSPSRVDRKQALVIGNSAYPKAPLRNPANDAAAMERALKQLGFEVIVLRDLTLAKMESAMEDFASELTPGSLAFFYFSGHGIQVNYTNYLLPVDFDAASERDVKYKAYPATRIQEALEERAALRLIVLDACRNNPFKYKRDAAGGLAAMSVNALGTLIAFATGDNNTADDNPAETNGLYTKYLIPAMLTPGLTLHDTFQRAKEGVLRASRQRQNPAIYENLLGADSLAGSNAGGAPSVMTGRIDPAAEAWSMIKDSKDVDDFDSFLKEFPAGDYSSLARIRRDQLKRGNVVASGVATAPAQSLSPGALKSGDYHVTGKIPIGGDGGWDYLAMDSAARRLYVSHATKTVVVDVDAQRVVGEIADTAGVHGIAIASDLGRGFTSNGRSNDVTVFDLRALKTLATVRTGENPDAIVYEPVSNRVLTFNGRSKDATVIDAKTLRVVATIPLRGKPEFSFADGKGRVYVNIADTSEMVEIDARSTTVTKRFRLEGCEDPSGLTMDTKARRIFSVCANRVMVVSDPDAARVVATLPIGQSADGVGFDPERGHAFSSNGDGTLTVVNGSSGKYEVIQNVQTQRGARTLAVDTRTHKIYLPAAQYGQVAAPTTQNPRPRPQIIPDSFAVLVVEK